MRLTKIRSIFSVSLILAALSVTFGVRETAPALDGDDSPDLSRTISWADGRNMILLWKLPSPGR